MGVAARHPPHRPPRATHQISEHTQEGGCGRTVPQRIGRPWSEGYVEVGTGVGTVRASATPTSRLTHGEMRVGSRRAGSKWGREDSNLRRLSRRVYSPFPLAARAHPRGAADCSFGQMDRFDVAVIGAGPAGS